ncbi:MAG: TMEM43 family protein [Planctomycetota bacterium]
MGTHVTEESWFGRIGGAIKGILVGGLLTIVSVPVLFWNEGRAVRTAKGLKEGAKVVIDIKPEEVNSANEGKFVHTVGETATDEILRDEEFSVEYNGVRLKRHVEMFQWHEDVDRKKKKKMGGGTKTVTTYSYYKDWSSRTIASSEFDEPSTHVNPSDMLFAERSKQAKKVMLGGFRLSDSLVGMIRSSEPLELTEANVPTPYLNAATIRHDGPKNAARLYLARASVGKTGAEAASESEDFGNDLPANPNRPELVDLEAESTELPDDGPIGTTEPQIGDVRIWFTATPVTTVSLLSQQSGDSFQPYETEYNTSINVLREGTFTADEMIAQQEAANRTLTWVLRFVGALVMFFGLMLILRPLAVVADVLPFAGSIVGFGSAIVAGLLTIAGSMTVIGIAWVFYRPVLGVSLLVIAGVALFLLLRRKNATKEDEPETLTSMDLA